MNLKYDTESCDSKILSKINQFNMMYIDLNLLKIVGRSLEVINESLSKVNIMFNIDAHEMFRNAESSFPKEYIFATKEDNIKSLRNNIDKYRSNINKIINFKNLIDKIENNNLQNIDLKLKEEITKYNIVKKLL